MDTEKITFNIGAVDLGQIDLLVDQGFYSNRTDFIRTAVRTRLAAHTDDLQRIKTTNLFGLDAVANELNKVNLEVARAVEEVERINPIKLAGTSFAGSGVFMFNKQGLEEVKASGRKIEVRIVGMLVIEKDVPAELVKDTFQTVKVYGIIKATEEIKNILLGISEQRK